MHKSVLIAALLVTGCTSQQAPAEDRWHQLAAESDRLTATFRGKFWEHEMLPIHNEFWPKIFAACAPQAKTAGITNFKAVAVINKDGVVTEYLPSSNSPALKCFSEQMVGRKYPTPPESPFYEVYTINLETSNQAGPN
ncbi:hypothetical protein [Solilutibacter silvestris]|uniref:hypothetical protein n=1 Tax=Solilutibacter silvestris TaxID=1645665 RepID=UPI00101ADAEC|nr:hypothetical protein [Lysobacter silvestris]